MRLALENARLQVHLRAQLDEVQQSRTRLVEAADSERRRLERDLHDGAQQRLVTILLSLQLAKVEALRSGDQNTAHMLDGSIASLRQALEDLRSLARGIHPSILVEGGLAPAIRALAERCPVRVEVTGDLERLERRLEAALYFVAAEGITNALKHSRGSRICVELCRRSEWAGVRVSDDGVGGQTCRGARAWSDSQTGWQPSAVDSACRAAGCMAPACTPKFRARKRNKGQPDSRVSATL